jgi:hypothetical protein
MNLVRTFTQVINMNKTNINVSTGGATYTNVPGSITCFGSGSSNTTADPCFGTYFQLNDIPQAATFTSLFDQYRIDKITVVFTPNLAITGIFSAANALLLTPPQLWYAIDYDNASVIAPLTSLMEYEGVRMVQAQDGKPITITFKPRAALAAYAGAFTSYANVGNMWIDCANTTVQHYGVKWGIPCPVSTSFVPTSWSANVEYTISFRGVI